MPKKKITVVDIKDSENADIVDSNEVTRLEPIIEEKPIVEDKPVEEKIVRTNELIQCPK